MRANLIFFLFILTFVTISAFNEVCAADAVDNEIIWLDAPIQKNKLRATPPYWLVCDAHTIAYAQVKETDDQKADRILFTFEKIIKGKLPHKDIDIENKLPIYGCIVPPNIPKATTVYQPGSHVVIYLKKIDDTWKLTAIYNQKDYKIKEKDIKRIEAFQIASQRRRPSIEYQKLLDDKQGGFDEMAYHFFSYSRDDSVVPLLNIKFSEMINKIKKNQATDPQHLKSLFQKLTQLMLSFYDEKSVRLVVTKSNQLPLDYRCLIYRTMTYKKIFNQKLKEKLIKQITHDISTLEQNDQADSPNHKAASLFLKRLKK